MNHYVYDNNCILIYIRETNIHIMAPTSGKLIYLPLVLLAVAFPLGVAELHCFPGIPWEIKRKQMSIDF